MPSPSNIDSMLASLVATALLTASGEIKPNSLTLKEEREGFHLLFDGKSFKGWRGFLRAGMPESWEIRDGAIWKNPELYGGDIMTIEQFADFDLRFQWKVTAGANSGVFFRVTEEGKAVYHTGPEYQILDDDQHPDGKSPLTSAASCYGIYPRTSDPRRPVGTWNDGRIVVRGKHVQHYLNGVKVVDYWIDSEDWLKRVEVSKFKVAPTYGHTPSGSIALQDHGNEVSFRSIRIRPL